MIKIALIGIVGILLALQIKAVKPEYAVYLCMGVSLLIFMGVTEQLQIIVDAIQAIEIKCTLCQGHYDFFLFRFLFYICLLCRGIKVMPLIDCFHLLL